MVDPKDWASMVPMGDSEKKLGTEVTFRVDFFDKEQCKKFLRLHWKMIGARVQAVVLMQYALVVYTSPNERSAEEFVEILADFGTVTRQP